MNIRDWMYGHTSPSLSRGFQSRRWRDDAAVSLIRSGKGNDFFLRGFLFVSDWEDKTGCGHTACGLVPCLGFLHGGHLPDKDEDGKHPTKVLKSFCLLQYSQYSTTGTLFTAVCFRGRATTAGDVKLRFQLQRKTFLSWRMKQFAINSVSLETTAVASNTISVNWSPDRAVWFTEDEIMRRMGGECWEMMIIYWQLQHSSAEVVKAPPSARTLL